MESPKLSDSIFEQFTKNNWDAVVYARLDGTIEYANDAAEKLYGYDSGELVGMHVDVFNAQKNADTGEIIQAIIDSGGWSGELIQKKKDGTEFDAQLTVFLVYNDSGEPIGYASNSKDVSERNRLQKQLSDSELHLRTINSHIPYFIYEVDREYKIQYLNRISEHYSSVDDLIGMKVSDFVPPEYKAELESKIDQVFESAETGTFETMVEHPSGERQYFSYSLSPIIDGESVRSVIGIAEDITEKVVRDGQLKEALKEKDILLAEIHHRLKNNLAVISSLLQIQAHKSDSPELKEILEDSQSKIKTTALVHEMLYENESLTNIKFADYIERLATEIGNSFSSKEKKIDVKIDAKPIDLDIQSAIPCGLFLNEALMNSYKHAFINRTEGEISVEFKESDDGVKLVVTDNGNGFEPGFSLDQTETMGLTLLKTFAEQLGGEMRLTNNGDTKIELEFNP